MSVFVMVVMATAATGASAAATEKEYLAQIDKLLPGMGAGKIEDRKDAQLELEKMCFSASAPGKDAERRALCRAMVQRLDTKVPRPARVWLLRKLEPLGREEVIGALASLLHDQDPEIRDLARRALANNPSPQAAAALRAELSKAADNAWRVALINALGFRRDTQSVPQLAELAADQDDTVARAALSALGEIGGDAAADAIGKLQSSARPALRDEITNVRLRIAEDLLARGAKDRATTIYRELSAAQQPERIRIAALHGLARAQGPDVVPELLKVLASDDVRMRLVAVRIAEQVPGKEATRQLLAALDGAAPAVQAGLVDALGQRGDDTASGPVRSRLEAADEQVRIAALGAIAYLGGPKDVLLLIERAAKTTAAERDAARASLARLRAEGVDEAILKALDGAKPAARPELIRAAAARQTPQAKPAFLAAARDADPAVRLAGVVALAGCTTGKEDMPNLLALLKDVDKIVAGLADPALEREVSAALLTIAKRVAIAHPAEAAAALEELRQTTGDDALRGQIEQALDQFATYCLSWLVSGPYRTDGKKGGDLIDLPFAPEQTAASAQWRPLATTNTDQPGRFDLGKESECCVYVKTTVVVDRQQQAQLLVGSDDGVKVWLNGQVVHANNASRGVQCGQDKVPVTLQKGPNPLMLKITQGGGDWGFCCQVKSADNQRLAGLQFKAE